MDRIAELGEQAIRLHEALTDTANVAAALEATRLEMQQSFLLEFMRNQNEFFKLQSEVLRRAAGRGVARE